MIAKFTLTLFHEMMEAKMKVFAQVSCIRKLVTEWPDNSVAPREEHRALQGGMVGSWTEML